MCGIVAYTGDREAQPILLDALSRLEYRGYDSSGTAIRNGEGIKIQKKLGRISELSKEVQHHPVKGRSGISHTRWATHGKPSDVNAHPHQDHTGNLALVHNGVIDNHQTLKKELIGLGHEFHSDTDTEVLAHLFGEYYEKSGQKGETALVNAVKLALSQVQGTYGIALVHLDCPDLVLGARRGSPLVVGIGENEQFIASDAPALLPYTQKVVYLKDFDLVHLHPDRFHVENIDGAESDFEIKELDISPEEAELGNYPHFMLKEIYEQPTAIENALRGRLSHEDATARLGGLNLTNEQLRDTGRIVILGSGTALHAGMVGEAMLEAMAQIPTETNFGSEFRYSNTPIDRNSLFFIVSQSGETADSLGAMREAQRKGYRALGICNVVGSTIARESDGGIYMHAGPEIGVAATKSFVSQVMIFALLSVLFGRMRHQSARSGAEMIEAMEALPLQVTNILHLSNEIKMLASQYAESRSMLYFGRNLNYPVALEGALKMKEISYIHAEGYPSSELKHGVIALIDEATPSICIATKDSLYEKNLNTIHEIKARGGPVIAIAHEDDEQIGDIADHVIPVPHTFELLQPILNVIPLQLLSYHTAVALGRDVDKPRNLAKSVTVE
ncbi:MAG: glutamine--fructose-6-phosphate transaminase (isomerizing) [Verrucomicrobiota bacterium]